MPPGSHIYECATCGKDFPRETSRDQHCESTGHSAIFKCDGCDRIFRTYESSFQHMESKNHFFYECRYCDETWPDETQLEEHEAEHFPCECRRCDEAFLDEDKRKKHEADDHYLCAECDRSFDSGQQIQQHLRSRRHNNTRNMSCPLCSKAYTTAAGFTHHIESGACRKAVNMNRAALFAFVRAHDPQGAVSKKLIGWHGEKKYEATDWAWNGSGYVCFYFCFKSFSTLKALNQHLASPIHQQALYHCPNTKCAKDFKVLGGLISHLESEKCGAMRFDKVQASVERLIRGGRLLM